MVWMSFKNTKQIIGDSRRKSYPPSACLLLKLKFLKPKNVTVMVLGAKILAGIIKKRLVIVNFMCLVVQAVECQDK